jgi:NADP-dependent aldehyde dehydrogenase
MLHGQNYIGNTTSAESEKTFNTFNPLLNKKNEFNFYEASKKEIKDTINLAQTAFQKYKLVSGKTRASFLEAIVEEILLIQEKIVEIYCKETGLPVARANGELTRTIGQLDKFANLLKEGNWVNASIDTGDPKRTSAVKPDLRKISIPLGPVVVFGASNFPLAYSTAGGDTVSALAAGCPVIVKSHPMHAGTGELVASAIVKAVIKCNLPNGVFSNLNSSGIQLGIDLVENPNIKAVGFTGSLKAGRSLMNIANNRELPIPVFAEMGSVNPVIILNEILSDKIDSITDLLSKSITLGSGQFCTNPGIIIGLKSKTFSDFSNILAKKITDIDSTCMLHPNIINNYNTNKSLLLNSPNVTNLTEGQNNQKANFSKQGLAFVSASDFLKDKLLHNEVFGPFSLLVECDNLIELEEVLNNLEGQLTGTIMGTEKEILKNNHLIESLKEKVGRLIINGVPTGVEVCASMLHGGPFPASSDSRFSAVGIHSIQRWVRPVSYQDFPDSLLPDELKNHNPLNITRLVNGVKTKKSI